MSRQTDGIPALPRWVSGLGARPKLEVEQPSPAADLETSKLSSDQWHGGYLLCTVYHIMPVMNEGARACTSKVGLAYRRTPQNHCTGRDPCSNSIARLFRLSLFPSSQLPRLTHLQSRLTSV